jgi:signal transduction histidine kinase
MQARIGRELDEMESMVREALALFRGLDDGEPASALDVDALVAQIRDEFRDMGATVTTAGHALRPFVGKPQALKRCLTNLIANAVKFGTRADIHLEDGADLLIRVRDRGPGIPEEELERVFEPFYRLESSRNRDSGGTGLGLSIARDIAQSHGGSLLLANRPAGGLEATLRLPRRR